jgi:hypothetical protein
MDRWNEQMGALAQSLDAFGAALGDQPCSSEEILGLATVVQFELNQRFGCGNCYTGALVRMVGHSIPRFETEMPVGILFGIAQLMRMAMAASGDGSDAAPAQQQTAARA